MYSVVVSFVIFWLIFGIILGQYPVSLGSLSEACFPEDIQMAVKNMSEEKREKKGKK
jgi:hypothetical protein